jgi:hypothetical protein
VSRSLTMGRSNASTPQFEEDHEMMSGPVRDTLVIPQQFLGRDGQPHDKFDFQCSCGYHTGKGAQLSSQEYCDAHPDYIVEFTYTIDTLFCDCGAEWPAVSWELGSGKIVTTRPRS